MIPGGYPPNTHKVSQDFFINTMAVFITYKGRPIKLYPTLHLSPVKCPVNPKAASFTKIRVCKEPNIGMMQVKPTAKDFTKCKDQILISLKFSQEKIRKDSKYPPITWKK
jgi:hypothetical protein